MTTKEQDWPPETFPFQRTIWALKQMHKGQRFNLKDGRVLAMNDNMSLGFIGWDGPDVATRKEVAFLPCEFSLAGLNDLLEENHIYLVVGMQN